MTSVLKIKIVLEITENLGFHDCCTMKMKLFYHFMFKKNK